MSLPEKVRDVTQSEWLEVRERLAAAEAQSANDAALALTYWRQWCLAMTWGAEVCATLDSPLVGWNGPLAYQANSANERAERAEADLAAARAQLAAANDQHERTMRYFHEALSFAKPRDSRAQSLLDAIEALRRGHEQRKAFNSIGPRPCDEEEIARLRAQLAAVVGEAREERNRLLRVLHNAHVRLADGRLGSADIIGWPDLHALADTAQAAREHEERVRADGELSAFRVVWSLLRGGDAIEDGDVAAAVGKEIARITANEARCESKVAEWQSIAGNATEAANAAWKPFAEVALVLGYKRAASPDFGEVDLVPLREHIRALGSRS